MATETQYSKVSATSNNDYMVLWPTGSLGVELDAGKGNDTVFGTAFSDKLSGNVGNDLLIGGQGKDWLGDGAGSDTLIGGEFLAFDPSGKSKTELLQRIGGGVDTYQLQNDGSLDLIYGFDGIGGNTGGVQDTLKLKGYGAGAELHFAGANAVVDFFGVSMQSQLYTVTKGGAVLDTFWLYNFGANAADASKTLERFPG